MSGDRSLGIGDLPVAGPVSATDTLAICQSPTGCFASDSSVTLRGVSQSQLATYYQSTFAGNAPITFSGGNIGLAIDNTLQVTGGQLGVSSVGSITGVTAGPGLTGGGTSGNVTIGLSIPVAVASGGTGATDGMAARNNLGAAPIISPNFLISAFAPTPPPGTNDTQIATTAFVDAAIGAGGGIVVPNGPLLSGNGTELGVVSLGTGLSMAGGFPGQTLNVSGFLPLGGGTMTGLLTMGNSNATLQTWYIGGVSGPALRIGDPATGFYRGGALTSSSLYLNVNGSAVQTWDPANTPRGWSQLALDLNMTNHYITALLDPLDPQDAATKAYVDAHAGGGPGGGITSITAGTGLTGGTITTSGTIALASPVATTLGGTGSVGPYMMNSLVGGVILGQNTSLNTSQFMIQGSNNRSLQFYAASDSPTQAGELNSIRIRGAFPPAAPGLQPVLSGDALGTISFDGFDNVLFQANYSSTIRAFADGNWGPGARGSHLEIAVTPSGSTGAITMMNIGSGGVSLAVPLSIGSGGTGAINASAARTALGLTVIATQPSPLGALYGGTGIQPASGQQFNNLIATPTGVGTAYQYINSTPASTVAVPAGSVLQSNASGPPSFVLPVPVTSGGTGATTFPTGNFIGMGGAGAFVGVPTPIAVGLGGTGATTFTPTGAVLLGSGTAAVRASQLMTQTSDNVGLQMQTAGAIGPPYFDMYWASSGTISSPGPTQPNDNLGGVYAGGADASGWSNGGECAITFFATQAWTTVSHPTQILFGTTAPGALGSVPRLAISQGLKVPDNVLDMGIGTINVQNGYYANNVGAEPLAISWLAGIDPNNAVLVVAQRALRITNITAVIRASNAGATLQLRRGDGTNMTTAALDLGQVPGVYQLTPSITTLAAGDFMYLATSGTFTTSVAHVTVAVA